ncbi:origin recognition complex, subunit 2, partial [Blyttiomyces helicus]
QTSNNTLSKLPTLEYPDFLAALKLAPPKHTAEIATLTSTLTSLFPQWAFEVSRGFNLLFYGYGSKRTLLNKFARAHLAGGENPLIVVNGFFPAVTIKKVMASVISDVVGHTGPAGSLAAQVSRTAAYFASPHRTNRNLTLLIHNIDGIALRSDAAQATLSALAAIPAIRIVASIDHINAPLLWDAVTSARFDWVWHNATTFAPYAVETGFETSLLVKGGAARSRGVEHVLRSVTATARTVFRMLAEHQIAAERDKARPTASADAGMPYDTLLQRVLAGFVLSNEQTLKSHLSEFKDHEIVMPRRTKDGTDLLHVPFDAATLETILERM